LLGVGQLHFLLWQAHADGTKAERELGVRVRPWREGLEATVAALLGRESG
jgi:hypothetical protein